MLHVENSLSSIGSGPRIRKKLVIVGDGECGKTCLLMAHVGNDFRSEYIPTVFDNYNTDIDIGKNTKIQFSLWDTAGQEDYDRLRPLSYPDTDVVLLVFGVGNWKSFENIKMRWMGELQHFLSDVPIILVGTMMDVRNDSNYKIVQGVDGQERSRCVSYEEGEALNAEIGAQKYLECSAKTLQGVQEVFTYAAISCYKKGKRFRSKKCNYL